MLKTLLLILVFAINSYELMATVPLQKALPYSPQNEDKNISLAKRIKTFIKTFQKGDSVPSKDYSSLRKRLSASDLFSIYQNPFRQLYSISKSKSFSQVLKKCNQLIDADNLVDNNLFIFDKSIRKGCSRFLFELLSKYSQTRIQLAILKKYIEKNDYLDDKITRSITRGHKQSKIFKQNVEKLYTGDFQGSFEKGYYASREVKTLSRELSRELDEPKPNKGKIRSLSEELIYYFQLFTHLSSPKFISRYHIGPIRKLIQRQYFKEARRSLKPLFSNKNRNIQEESHFYFLLSYHLEKLPQKAMSHIKSNDLHNKFAGLDPKLQFWIAKTHLDTGEKVVGRFFFKHILKSSPLNYYAVLSSIFLGDMNKDHAKYLSKAFGEKTNSTIETLFSQVSKKEEFQKKKERIHIWAKANLSRWAGEEVKEIYHEKNIYVDKLYLTKQKKKLLLERMVVDLTATISENKKHLSAFKVMYKGLDNKSLTLNNRVLKTLFPHPYVENIKESSPIKDLDLVYSLIRQESGFNPKAVSRVGARGLMQLMPTTAQRFKKRVRIRDLYDPSLNIKIGSQYLNLLLKKYDGNIIYSLAAYNAGESRVNFWNKTFLGGLPPLEGIELIPFRETRLYVKLIFRNMFFYKILKEDTDSAMNLGRNIAGSFRH